MSNAWDTEAKRAADAATGKIASENLVGTRLHLTHSRSQVRRRRMSRVSSIDLAPVNGSCGLRPAATSYPTFLRLACRTCSHARSPQGRSVRTTRSAPASYSRTSLRTRNITRSRPNSLRLTSSPDARPALHGSLRQVPAPCAGARAHSHHETGRLLRPVPRARDM